MHCFWRGVFCLLALQSALLWANGATGLRLPPAVRRPPAITSHPPDVHYALPESKIILPCAADAMPAVLASGRYYWKKDGRILNISEQDEGNKSIQFLNPKLDGSLYFNGSELMDSRQLSSYAGKYRCFATNEYGTALSSETDLRIAVVAPFVSPTNENLEVTEGDSLLVPCHENVTEDVEIKWSSDVKEFEFSNRIAQASDGTIIFSNVEKEDDELVFYCSFKYISTRTATDGIYYTLSVKTDETVEDQQPNIIRPNEENDEPVALKGEDIKLTCIATGKPTPSVYWTRNGRTLFDDVEEDDARFVMIDFNRTLHIMNVKYEDEGEYTCTAYNDMGLTTKSVQLVVDAKPHFPDENKRPTDMIKLPGDVATVWCALEGKPEPDIVWMRNGIVMDGDKGRGVRTKNKIVFWNVVELDTAVYQCMGTNKHGTVMGQGFLNVLTSPPVPFPENKLVYRVMEGNTVVFKCEMFAAPSHYTNWTMFGQPQKNLLWSEKITAEDEQALKIARTNVDDSGMYECKATNPYGSATINITLIVLYVTEVSPINKKELYFVPKGQDVNMSVTVITDANLSWWRATWYKDQHEMGTGITLNLLSVTPGDAGKYTVIVETEFDKAYTSMKLIVQDVPDLATGLTFTKDEDDPFAGTLNWVPPGDNHSPITGYVVEFEPSGLERGRWDFYSETPDGVNTRLRVEDLLPHVSYRFRVWAENAVGRSGNASHPSDPYLTPSTAPTVNPTGVAGEGTAPDNMVISWDPVEPIRYAGPGFGYVVSWCLESNCTWQRTFFSFNESSHTVTDTPAYTRYLIKVKSWNDLGPGPEADIIVGYSGEDVPSEAPSEVTHKVGNDSKVTVTWKAVPEEKMRGLPTGYIVQAKGTKTGEVVKTIVGPNDLQAELELEVFTEYEITVAALNGAGASDPSVAVKLKTPQGVPDAPENFTLIKQTRKELKTEWEEPSKVKGIIILYRLKYKWKEGNETKSKERSTAKRKMKLNGLLPNTSYNLTLCAKTSRGYGNDCAHLIVSTLKFEPKKPSETKFDVIAGQTQANVWWERNDEDRIEGIPVRSYRIEHRIAEAGREDEKWVSASTVPETPGESFYNVTIQNLSPGTMYEFRITTTNEFGETASNTSMHKTAGTLHLANSGIVGQPWFIVVLCVAALIVLIIVIICFMRRREGGKYSVSEKEEQLVKLESHPMNNYESGKYSVNSTNDNLKEENGPKSPSEETDRPNRLRGDSVGGNSIEAFGSGDTREYEEDGSFIDQYGVDRRSHSKSGVSSPVSEESKDVTSPETRLLSDADRAAH